MSETDNGTPHSITTTGDRESAGKGEQVFYSKNIQGFWSYYVRKLKTESSKG